MKVIESLWFSGKDGCVGIIVDEDSVTGERKAYIGSASGIDEEADIKAISDWGAKFPLSIVLRLQNLLIEKKGG